MSMPTVKVSSTYQVVIPRSVREALCLTPGQQMEVLLYNNRIELVPIQPMHRMRGFLAGLDTTVEREPDRDL